MKGGIKRRLDKLESKDDIGSRKSADPGQRGMSLTPKQARFVAEYLVDLNATQAAIRAGYSKKNADKIGPELLAKTRVAEAIAEAVKARSERTEIKQDMVLHELALIGFANAGNYFDWGPDGVKPKNKADLTVEQQAVVAEVSETGGTIRLKLHDKRAALVDIGRHLGMFKDSLNVGLTVRYEDALKELK